MTEKRFTHKDKSLYIDDDYFCELEDGDEIIELLNRQQYTVKTVWKENEQLKQVLGNILLEVKRDITNTSCTGEVKAFINPNSYDLISDVLRRYGALKGWYDD